MFDIDGDCEISELKMKDRTVANGETVVGGVISMSVTVDEGEVASLPFVGKAVAALMTESAKASEEEKHTDTLTIRRNFPPMILNLTDGDDEFTGRVTVKGNPQVKVVHGAATLIMKFDVNESAQVWATLTEFLSSDAVEFSTSLEPTPLEDYANKSEAA